MTGSWTYAPFATTKKGAFPDYAKWISMTTRHVTGCSRGRPVSTRQLIVGLALIGFLTGCGSQSQGHPVASGTSTRGAGGWYDTPAALVQDLLASGVSCDLFEPAPPRRGSPSAAVCSTQDSSLLVGPEVFAIVVYSSGAEAESYRAGTGGDGSLWGPNWNVRTMTSPNSRDLVAEIQSGIGGTTG